MQLEQLITIGFVIGGIALVFELLVKWLNQKGEPLPEPEQSPYPMHEKLALISDKSQTIHDFLEWAEDTRGYSLGEWQKIDGYHDEQFWPTRDNDRDLLADFFDIDLNVLDNEKIAMLEAQRELSKEVYGA